MEPKYDIPAIIEWYRVRGRLDTLYRRFDIQTEPSATGCIDWIGRVTSREGYGRWQLSRELTPEGGRTVVMAHRFAFVRAGKVLPRFGYLDHLCRNTRCVNPDHLEVVTIRENLMRSPVVPAALNAAKTQCPQGHPYDERNTIRCAGRRICRTCNVERTRQWLLRQS